MWRSSPETRGRRRGPRGFTLLEAMVSLMLLVIVLTLAMTMLFQMRAFAERQQFYMLPRQGARRAAEYIGYYVATASDLNDPHYTDSLSPTNPNALVMYYVVNGNQIQATYDNLTGSETGNSITSPGVTKFGDVGTDILTLVAPVNPGRYAISPPFPTPLGTGVDLYLGFRGGCGTSNAQNTADFQAATGFDGTQSAMMLLEDRDGRWLYFQIPAAGYITADTDCADVTTYKNVHVQADTSSASLPRPPNAPTSLTDPVFLATGIQIISFRVRTDPADNIPKLQQKLGLFDPGTDNPGTAFVNVMENIEDLQFAYLYRNGTIWNTSTQTIANGVAGCAIADCDNRIPPQAGPGAVTPEGLDVTDVVGVRLSVTARSPLLSLGARQLTNIDVKADLTANPQNLHFRPASENHPVTMSTVTPTQPVYDQFDHYRATTTLLVRNRALGN